MRPTALPHTTDAADESAQEGSTSEAPRNRRGGRARTGEGNSVLFFDVWKDSRATSGMVDVLIDEQEMPEPVRLRAICVVSDEWEKLGRIRHQRTM